MKKKTIILSIALLFSLFDCKQTANAQTRKTDDQQQINNIDTITARNRLDSLFDESEFTRVLLADGTIKIELTNAQTPYLSYYSLEQDSSEGSYKRFLYAIIIIGILVCSPLIYYAIFRPSEKAHKKYLENLRIFKQEADKIEVHLKDCEIKQRARYEKIEKSYRQQKYDAFDSQIFGIHRDDTKELLSCMVTFKVMINDNIETFCIEIGKDKLTLYFLFAQQKTTFIYVDKLDKDNYYLDLEFLTCR